MKPKEYIAYKLSRREYSEQQIRDLLQKKEYSEEEFSPIVNQMVQDGLICDERFSRTQIRYWMLTTSMGPKLMQQKLYQKGVAASVINTCIEEEYSYEDQLQIALKKASQKQERSKDKSPFEQKVNLQKFLQQKGFSYTIISEVIETLVANE